MKNTLAAIALSLSFSTAFAGDYTNAAAETAFCENNADIAVSEYRARIYKWHPREYWIDQLKSQNLGERANRASIPGLEYAYDSAVNEKDAYTRAWAMCMDVVAK